METFCLLQLWWGSILRCRDVPQTAEWSRRSTAGLLHSQSRRAPVCCAALCQVWSHSGISHHSLLGAWARGERGRFCQMKGTRIEACVCSASLSRFGLQLCTFSKCWLVPWMLSLPLWGWLPSKGVHGEKELKRPRHKGRNRYEGSVRRRSQPELLDMGKSCFSGALKSTYKWKRHTLMPRKPLWQNVPSVHNLISEVIFNIHFGCRWRKATEAFGLFCVQSVHIAHSFLNFTPLDADEIEKAALLLLCHGASLTSSSLSFCLQHGCALGLFSQRIRQAECWGLLHTKKLRDQRKQPYCGLQTSDWI